MDHGFTLHPLAAMTTHRSGTAILATGIVGAAVLLGLAFGSFVGWL